jgi:CBS domain-containing protein
MQSPPRTIDAGASVGAAIEMMLGHRIGHLPVVSEDRLLGVVTNRELAWYRARLGDAAGGHPVTEAMRHGVVTAAPDDTIEEVADRLADGDIDGLPITEGDRLVGLVTATDVLTAGRRPASAAAGPTAGDVMTAELVTARPDDNLLDAAGRMQSRDVRHLPVIDGDNKLLGMLSDRDLRSAVGYLAWALDAAEAPAELERLHVEQAMSRDVMTTTAETPLKALAAELAARSVEAVPVINDGRRLIGMVSVVDVLRGLSES